MLAITIPITISPMRPGSPNLETMAEPRRARTNRTTSVMSSCSRSSMTANRDSLITLFLRIDV